MTIYRASLKQQINIHDPLHVKAFYPDLKRHHYKVMQDRQDLIFHLASLHAEAIKSKMPLNYCEIPMRLVALREWVYDFEVVFNYFFRVKKRGFNISNDNYEISVVVPRDIGLITKEFILSHELSYEPPSLPNDGVVSKVFVNRKNKDTILSKLKDRKRLDLSLPVKWLLNQPSDEVNFYFIPAGKLKQRDTSVWPICGIETWPAWLREDLFGAGVDIESAYTQFLIKSLNVIYADRQNIKKLLYYELYDSLENKKAWREDICKNVLGLEINDENISIVKKICMSLANGSRVSPAILVGFGGYSITKDIIINSVDNISSSNLEKIGARLKTISSQYLSARKAICLAELKLNPSKKNQKAVFANYFKWEREARYKIWEEIGRHGIMVHDGIDGVPAVYLDQLPNIIDRLDIKLT